MKKAIIFDFGQTLANSADGFRVAEKEAELQLFSFMCTDSWDSFISDYRRLRQEFHQRSDFSRKALWGALCREYGVRVDDLFLEECQRQYWETVEKHTVLFPETLSTTEQLSRSYRLAVVTNTQGQTDTTHHRLGQFPELTKFMESIIVAGASGIPSKPHWTPFRLCLESLGLPPAEAVFVGDDLRVDIYGAKAAGIDPIWIKHHLVRRSWPETEAVFPVISSLSELLALDQVLHGEKVNVSNAWR
jgi:putative hydrolase of the HAD superfamily